MDKWHWTIESPSSCLLLENHSKLYRGLLIVPLNRIKPVLKTPLYNFAVVLKIPREFISLKNLFHTPYFIKRDCWKSP